MIGIYNAQGHQISVDDGFKPVKTLYKRLLIAGPTRASVRAPLLFAHFCDEGWTVSLLIIQL